MEKKSATKKKNSKKKLMSNTSKPEGMSLTTWQVGLRVQQGEKEAFDISEVDANYTPGEYCVENHGTRNKYKVVYRGAKSEWNYCSCFDFKTSKLGTCKHIEAVKKWIKENKKKVHRETPAYTSVYVDYKDNRKIKIRFGEDQSMSFYELAIPYFDKHNVLKKRAYATFNKFLLMAKSLGSEFRCYDDAMEMIIEERDKEKRSAMMDKTYTDTALDQLLTVNLYPYQKEGVRFAVKVGKCIIADEMGLGKTVQAIAAAEIMIREGLAGSVLVVCPTSLKYQWKQEIERFTNNSREVLVIEGTQPKRSKMYDSQAHYKIVSYHAACNDVKLLGKLTSDMLIMDEIQRLKNWDTQISRAARKIESHYSVLLSGTPLENKLEELYANMELVDQFCLGPYYLFRHNHILLNPTTGAIEGYKNLNSIGEQISGRLIRRTKKSVRLQLPTRRDQTMLVPMTSQQRDIHDELKWNLSMILRKFEKYHFLSETDRRRIMLLLGQMRMVADSTFILDEDLKSRHDMKIDETMNLIDNIFVNEGEKVVVFSEWERMTRLLAMELEKREIGFEYFNGRLSAKKRGEMVGNFRKNPESRVFISTDAGATGLNLQTASTLINMDLPWNPAKLEQRVARIFRLGQENPVQIINLVSKDSFEESLIAKLRFKSSMAEGVLDGGEDTVFFDKNKFQALVEELQSAMEEMPESTQDEEEEEENQTETKATEEPTVPQKPSGEPSKEPSKGPENKTDERVSKNIDNKSDNEEQKSENNSQRLISQGFSFLSGLAETLKSPEATRELIDNIVETDTTTGESSIKIPVESKESVEQVFNMFQKLFSGIK